jgi:hypothetical protein
LSPGRKEKAGGSWNLICDASAYGGAVDAEVGVEHTASAGGRKTGNTPCKKKSRETGGRLVQVRKGNSIEPTYLDFDSLTQTSTFGMTVAEEKSGAKQFAKSSTQADIRQRFLDVIAQTGGVTHRSVCETVGGKTQRVNDTVNGLLKDQQPVNGMGEPLPGSNTGCLFTREHVDGASCPSNSCSHESIPKATSLAVRVPTMTLVNRG